MKNFNNIEIVILRSGETATKDLPQNNLFILNTTPLSTADEFWKKLNIEKLSSPIWFFDVIYNPSPTWLFSEFQKRSFYVMNGYGMFEAQAQLSFSIWFSLKNRHSEREATCGVA